MSDGRKKTLLRSIRITQDLDGILQADARAKRVSVNALISILITKYAEWDRYTEKFGFVSLTREGLRGILEAAEEEKLTKAAEDLGARIGKEFMMFRFKKVNVKTFLEGLSLFARYGGIAEWEADSDGRSHTIAAHHDLGAKWSSYLGRLLDRIMETSLRIVPQVELTKTSVILRFSEH